jgi:alpha/beta superfamily hydrolase
MPELIINGPAGRLEARYHHETPSNSPIALILHPHPQFGGTMNNQVVYALYYMFVDRGFSVLRFNFRGVGRSQGYFDNGPGELSDAASALDWLQLQNPDSRSCWIAGVSFGTWIAMQLLMRRPEIDGFICVAPPANLYDFSFLAPCPSSGLMVNGDRDRVVPSASVGELAAKTKVQRGVKIEHAVVPDANHFFQDKIDDLVKVVGGYLDRRTVEMEAERKEG